MQVKISHRHGTLSPEATAFIRDKADKLTQLFERVTFIEVTVDLQHADRRLVEVRVDAEHKHDFIATDEHAELYTAVEMCLDRMKHQIQKYKEKIQDHRRDPHRGQTPPV